MFTLPDLGYDFEALEPYIDAKTMEIHHDKHHSTYVSKLNDAIAKHPDLENESVEQILPSINDIPEDIRTAVRNNGGGHHNHSLFWETMKPGGAKQPEGSLADALKEVFGSLDDFKAELNDAAIGRFGSGWAWLVSDGGKLEVYSTANQDSPLMENKAPLLGLDVWEHAYYLKYQNRRPEYVDAWWNVVNWDVIAERFAKLS